MDKFNFNSDKSTPLFTTTNTAFNSNQYAKSKTLSSGIQWGTPHIAGSSTLFPQQRSIPFQSQDVGGSSTLFPQQRSITFHSQAGAGSSTLLPCQIVSSVETQVHEGFSCDVTGMNPIVGVRCHRIGADYDLCNSAFEQLQHRERASYEIIMRVGDLPIPYSTYMSKDSHVVEENTYLRKDYDVEEDEYITEQIEKNNNYDSKDNFGDVYEKDYDMKQPLPIRQRGDYNSSPTTYKPLVLKMRPDSQSMDYNPPSKIYNKPLVLKIRSATKRF